ncbi:hypothetical protein PG995_005230 [Apiospora arundinis]
MWISTIFNIMKSRFQDPSPVGWIYSGPAGMWSIYLVIRKLTAQVPLQKLHWTCLKKGAGKLGSIVKMGMVTETAR